MGGTGSWASQYRERALASLNHLPPFSPIVHRLVHVLADDEATYGELAELIERDTVLAGNILRLVNSALYGRRGTVASVRHAITLVGLVRLRNLVLTLSVAQIWTNVRAAPSWSHAQFNLHSVATAIMADLMAQKLPVNYGEGAFVAGLLHDLGLLLIATGLPREFERIRQCCLREGTSLVEAERRVIGLDHAQLTAEALAQWNLPAPVQRAARYQLTPEAVENGVWPLSRVVHFASRLVESDGLEVQVGLGERDADRATLLGQVEAPLPWLTLQEEFERELEPIRAFF